MEIYRIATIIIFIAENKYWWIIPKGYCAICRKMLNNYHICHTRSIMLCDTNTKYYKQCSRNKISNFKHVCHWCELQVGLGFYMKSMLIWCLVLTLTQAWQCDISFVDPTSPSIASAHTGSAPCWGAVDGTGSTHSRGRVNVFIHLTDCRNGATHWHCISQCIILPALYSN